jgi:SP family facilitated glucose transporter-like MFS transporter 1
MKILDIIAIVAVVMQVVSIYLPVVIVSRLLMGFYCAITTGVIPSWILSMSPSFTSGIFGTLSQFAIALGMGTAYCMGQFLEEHAMG